MSTAWDTTVRIDRLTMSPLTNFKFYNFYIEDHNQDTLIFAEYVEAADYRLLSMLDKKVDIGEAIMHNVVFKLQRLPKEKYFNIHFLIDFFEIKDETAQKQEKFKFSVSVARLKNVRFQFFDAAIGTSMTVTTQNGYVESDDMDIIGKKAFGDTMCLENSKIFVHIFDQTTIPGVDSTWFDAPIDSTIPDWDVWCKKFYLKDVNLKVLNNRIGVDKSRQLDFSDLHFKDIDLQIDSLRLIHERFTGWMRELHGKDHRGFELVSLTGHGAVSPTELAATQFKMITNNSVLGDSLVFKYKRYGDFFDFVPRVKMYSNLRNCHFTFGDLSAFAPTILQNEFIAANIDKRIEVNGDFKGKVNNFRAKNVAIKIGERSQIIGKISMKDVSIPDATFMYLDLEKVETNYSDLKSILPFVALPKSFQKLGLVNLKGNYTGFFQDFVAFGELNTAIGKIKSDLKLNLKGGKRNAFYAGSFQFVHFDIGQFLGQKDLGEISLSTQIKGSGLTLETLDAQLKNAKIDSFEFKKYTYENVLINGQFKQKRFDGNIKSRDQNINFNLQGIVDLNADLPNIDILGNVECIDFRRIKFSKENIGLHIDTFYINAIGNNIDNFEGTMSIKGIQGNRGEVYADLQSIYFEAKDYNKDTIYTDSIPFYQSTRWIELHTDFADVEAKGNFKLVHLTRSIQQFIRRHHPNLYQILNQNDTTQILNDSLSVGDLALAVPKRSLNFVPHQDFDLKLKINDSKNITELLDPNFKKLKDIDLSAQYDGTKENFDLNGQVGKVHFGDFKFQNIDLEGGAIRNRFYLNTSVNALLIKDSTFLPLTNVQLDAISDSVRFSIETATVSTVASDISIKGQFEIEEKNVILRLDTSNLKVLGLQWTINDNNYIKIGDKSLDIYNVKLTHEDKLIALSSLHEKGIKARLENIDLGWLYHLGEPLPKIELGGKFSADATMQDVFTQKEIAATVYFDTLIINDDYWGSNSKLVAYGDSLKSTFRGTFTHSSDFVDSLVATAEFTPTMATEDPQLQNWLDVQAELTGAKTKIMEYFLKEQIENTEGYADATARVFGHIKGKQTVMNIEGEGELIDLKTSVIFLKTRYALENGKIKMNNSGFHVDPAISLKNGKKRESGGVAFVEVNHPEQKGYIGGSLTHNHLKDFGLDLIAYFENNLVMNTQKGDNSTFYGTIYATGTANFKGPFERLKLTVDAISEPHSELVLPLGDPIEVAENNYINFVNKYQEVVDSTTSIKDQVLGGLDLVINARATPDINMKMIFDEKAGDIMEGNGFGDLTIKYSPTGELKMFGDYTIEEGNYLFTYKNLLNKPFDVVKGGTISWGDNNGDPYKARLDIQAVYKKKLGLTNLITPYLSNNADLIKLASKPTEVNLFMNLRGELFSPEISFDIDINDVNPKLRSYTDLVLRTIRSDKNQLNRQVFGMIALQQFLPVDNTQNVNAVSTGISTGISTFSELLSQQLSLYLNDLLADAIEDIDFISNFELDLNFNYQGETANTTDQSNVRVGGDFMLLDNKLRVYLGTNIDIAGTGTQNDPTATSSNQNYIGGDFIIEYYLTDNGQLKIRGYNRTESTILGRSNRTGIGISYQKEFDSWEELIASFKTDKTKRLEKRKETLEKRVDYLEKRKVIVKNENQADKINRQLFRQQKKLDLVSQKLKD